MNRNETLHDTISTLIQRGHVERKTSDLIADDVLEAVRTAMLLQFISGTSNNRTDANFYPR